MSSVMRPVPFPRLVSWPVSAFLAGGEGGVYRPRRGLPFLGASLGSLVGPAAGPHTQLAQNIAASYLAGGRFIELKTVQTLDGEDLAARIPRPCISAPDEGYNVEWSTELRVGEALDEYVKAWFLLHVLAAEFDLYPPPYPPLPPPTSPGQGAADFMFSMSVGYSLEGIRSKKIDGFIEGLKDASGLPVWEACYNHLLRRIGGFRRFDRSALDRISPRVSTVVTLSTLHGCPAGEIEGIARHLLEEKGLHVYVKCNPTLLGYERARRILDDLGYGYVSFDDRHFREDLRFEEALEMLGRLRGLALGRGLSFGVKMTNTLPVGCGGLLAGPEMYMSGRALFPLSIGAAALLEGPFGGELPISYSGGADFFNLPEILETGIRPVTVATTLLKPGGYGRLRQLAELPVPPAGPIDTGALDRLARAAGSGSLPRYRKSYRLPGSRPYSTRKSAAPLPLWDCAGAPCAGGCPLGQDIPRYLEALAAGDYGEAMRVIAADNPAPSITGAICDHPCQSRCTRLDYEDPLGIREAKALAASRAQAEFTAALRPSPLKTAERAAVAGAGPAGIAAAVFLRRAGVPVTVYEKREAPYGMVRYLIPAFRIPGHLIDRDYELALKTGVEFRFGVELGKDISLEALRRDYAYTILALGAWGAEPSPVEEGGEGITGALGFLEEARRDQRSPVLGKRVAVIGGGDVAVDCARLALRLGAEEAALVYRRAGDRMPAGREELALALGEGVKLLELRAPRSYRRGILRCEITRMEDSPGSGSPARRGFRGTGQFEDLQFDTVIAATGARADGGFYEKLGLSLDGKGLPRLGPGNESSVPGVYVVGDGRAGPGTVAGAIGDAKLAAGDILGRLGLETGFRGAFGAAAVSGTAAPGAAASGAAAPGAAVASGAAAPGTAALGAAASGAAAPGAAAVSGTAAPGAAACGAAAVSGTAAPGTAAPGTAASGAAASGAAACGAAACGAAALGTAALGAAVPGAAAACGAAAPEAAASGTVAPDPALYRKRAFLTPGTVGGEEAARCLSCQKACGICRDVCPNRANLGLSGGQIIHIDSLCNECGNCGVFCPYGGLPYRDKFTFFSLPEDFEGSSNPGFLPLGGGRFRLRLEGRSLEWGPGDSPGSPALGRAIEVLGAALREYGPLLGEKICS